MRRRPAGATTFDGEQTMALSMYQASVPVLTHTLTNLDAILGKAAAHAEARKIDPAVLIASRLYPDMLPLSRQVYIATDTAKGCAARLAGVEPPKYEDIETTFPELSARIRKTIAYLQSFSTDRIDGSEDKPVTLRLAGQSTTFTGQFYLLNFVIPNVFFHVTTAYDILRHCGVELGKRDFLGKMPD
jgi:hypothetical protein